MSIFRRRQGPVERPDGAPPAPAATWLETGARIAAVTDAGRPVEGVARRIYQTPADYKAGVFRVLCAPAEDSGGGEGAAP